MSKMTPRISFQLKNPTSRMATSNAESLPQEIIVDILSRLPAKFIGQYRCVSKQWCNFLSHPQFIKIYHPHTDEQKLIFISSSLALYTLTFNHNPQNGIDPISRKINFKQLSDNWSSVVCSCNGLVLVENQEHIMFLINPTTLEYHRIPTFDLALPHQSSYNVYGLGYDFATDDYKVVTLSRYQGGHVDTTFVDVYSAKVGLWRRLESLPYDDVLSEQAGSSGVLVNGAVHWIATKASSFVIVAFDLNEEKFLEVPAPTTLDNDLDWYDLRTLRGCLCMFCALLEDEIDVWMMREYRVEESWTRFRIARMDLEFGLVPFCPISNDDVVLSVDRDRLTVYNMKEDHWRYMDVDGITSMFERTGTFMESLVSPMFGKGTEG